MKSIYTDYLFDKYIFVSNGETGTDQFETLFALANLFNIRIIEGEKLVSGDMIKYAASRLGQNVPEPFYRGFPQSVRELSPDKLLFDQLVHYTITYGFGNFSEAGHSLFEENFEKTAFKENADIREFLLSTGDAILAEASPYDKIWGIGLDRETAMKGSVEQWQGENLLGCALMEVRDWLREMKNEG